MANYPTTSLFWETSERDYTNTKWTLKRREHHGYPSLYLIYMAKSDPSEYCFALETIGSWEQWERIASSPLIKPVIDRWRRELEVKIKADCLLALKLKAESGDSSAAKYLIENWKMGGTEKRHRGRPKKDPEPEQEIDWEDDLKRMELSTQ